MVNRLVIVCHKEEKMAVYALMENLAGSTAMCVIKDIESQQDLGLIFEEFSVAHDIFLCLMTENSHRWMQRGLSENMAAVQKRALMVIPVMMARTRIPYDFFSPLPVVSSTGDIKDLVKKIERVIENHQRIDYGSISPWTFENLVKDVLYAYHFEGVTLTYSDHVDFGYDMICTYKNQNAETENWLVEIKYASQGRFTIRTIDQIIQQDRGHYLSDHKLMLVANGAFTSAVGTYLRAVMAERKIVVYIVDGWKLRNLLVLKDKLVNKYFPYE